MAPSFLAAIAVLAGGALAVVITLGCVPGTAPPPCASRARGLFFNLVAPLLRTVARWVGRMPLRRLRAAVERARVRAGASNLDANEHLASSVLGGLTGVLVALFFLDVLGVLLSVAVVASAALYPLARLWSQARRRLAAIDRSLGHANDLLVLSLEAGLDLVGAIRQCVAKVHPDRDPLAGELHRVLGDLELGSTRRSALESMAGRAPTDAVKGFVSAVVQAEQRGTPLAQALRIQAATLRTARSQRIEARAGRAAVLVLLPLLLIFAATVLLVFGGVVVRAMRGELL